MVVMPFSAASLFFFDDVVHSNTFLTNNILSNRLSDLLIKYILVFLLQEICLDIVYDTFVPIVI